MAASVLSNAQSFRFKTFDLHGALESWEDDLPQRLATYEYLKRDGAEVDPFGAGQKKWVFHCAFVGPDCGTRYKELATSIDKDPRGALTHPRLGNFSAACRGLKARENPGQMIDVIEFTIELEENQVDQSIQPDAQFGAHRRASQVQDKIAELTDASNKIVSNRIANTVYSGLVAAVATVCQLADKFRLVALGAAQTTPDNLASDPTVLLPVTLNKLLGQIADKRDLVLTALSNTLPKTLDQDVALTDARTAARMLYAACLQLFTVVKAQLPPIVPFTVPTAMPLTVIAVRIYGAEAQGRMNQIYALNRIATPYWVPAGTVLQVVAPSKQ